MWLDVGERIHGYPREALAIPDRTAHAKRGSLVLGGWGTKTLDLSTRQHSAAARKSDHTARATDPTIHHGPAAARDG